ncbi:hypothetical protein BJ085DRAFT_28699 [Dimargaris cristalligena]|uniref:Uncharacterized protein n=1 Tax=Dimargaris cristalligena TaxID=215637 RepID=A0A4P9ZWY4_9FUNG|nr:hypothetical protein BJ085DRAFT_28699 [Dimargaris cristalligena]|eukprot:RKP38174.1 hypothetical protein BJ085DRAFT_28699 [Dimargaris cristalligena]
MHISLLTTFLLMATPLALATGCQSSHRQCGSHAHLPTGELHTSSQSIDTPMTPTGGTPDKQVSREYTQTTDTDADEDINTSNEADNNYIKSLDYTDEWSDE